MKGIRIQGACRYRERYAYKGLKMRHSRFWQQRFLPRDIIYSELPEDRGCASVRTSVTGTGMYGTLAGEWDPGTAGRQR